MKIDKSNPRHWLLLVLQAGFSLLGALIRAITPRPARPRVVFYSHQYSGNIKALYEHWRSSNRDDFDCYCLFLDPGAAQQAREQQVSTLLCHHPGDMLFAARGDVFITDHGLHALLLLKRLSTITFVDVWHGIPFKGFAPSDFTLQHTYDEVWVSSGLLQSLYIEKLAFPPTIVQPAGYARADKLFRGDAPENSFRREYAVSDRIVLYAPTWEHDDKSRSQMPFGETYESFFNRLGDNCRAHGATLVVRSHLNTRIDTANYAGVIFCSMADFPDTESLLQETDVLLCDWSSIAFDFLATNRPTLFLDVKPPFRNGYSLGPEYRFGPVVDSLDALATTLDGVLADPATYWAQHEEKHREISDAVYGQNQDGQVAQRQLDRVASLISAHRQ